MFLKILSGAHLLKSGKSYKLKKNPKGNSDKKVHAAILADQKAAQDAINPTLNEIASDKQILAKNDDRSHKISYANVRVIPHEMSFPQIGGLKHIRVNNSSGKRIAYMVKCSDNMLFSINPVFGIIETDRDAQINILRENGEAKNDKLVIITAAHSDKSKTAEQTFSDLHHNNSHNYNINVVPLLTQ
ncbi:Protein CBG26498 [Caenorhabditis briggsae]|uniref:Major sperm protein n=1 Tax=Caenorhabditis briggsae TaxID=6238 RepID=B6IFG2_CAEBR|nr:Protein CBG26498 [Caenorhabditis briggsae]CAR98642.1 Protein CBG26498 [Caenorhabditis briggsae]